MRVWYIGQKKEKLIPGKKYEARNIKNKIEIKLSEKNSVLVSKSEVLLDTKKAYIAVSNEYPIIGKEIVVKRLTISDNGIKPQKKESIAIVMTAFLSKKSFLVVDSEGRKFFILNAFLPQNLPFTGYNYIGVSKYLPVKGEVFDFENISTKIGRRKNQDFFRRDIKIDYVATVEEIGQNFYKVVGRKYSKNDKWYSVTIYLKVQ